MTKNPGVLLPFEKINRDILIKKEMLTDPNKGKEPAKRTVEELLNSGIINLDKPSGPTSHQVSAFVQNILKINKAGHSGTLDPKVTGVLPVALGKSTKVVEALLNAGKEYICIMHIHKEVDDVILKETISKKFIGKIQQLPPIKSAVKRQLRTREIYYIDIMEIDGKDVLFKVGCQAGTYIRKLCTDIGEELKVGAHMAKLRRTKAGPFNESTIFTLQDLTDAIFYYKQGNEKFIRKIIQPIENAVNHLPKVWVSDDCVKTVSHGADVNIPGVCKYNSLIKDGDIIAVMSLKNELVGFGKCYMSSDEIKDKVNGKVVKVDKVFIDRSIYK